MTSKLHTLLGLLICAIVVVSAAADDTKATDPDSGSDSDSKKYSLRYNFQIGETIRWEVLQQTRIRMTISNKTQVSEMVTKSVKLWRIIDVQPDGTATLENSVESVDMRRSTPDTKEVRYNSRTDEQPAPGYEALAQSIGVPVSVLTIDTKGELLKRERKPVMAAAQNEQGQVTIPLPEEAVPVGHAWSFRYEIDQPLDNGTFKKVRLLQTFKLESVKTGIATIDVATRILTPIHDPAVEVKLVQRESSGTVRFDVDAGRVVKQQLDIDRRVVGFTPNSPASSFHHVNRFTETLLTEEPKTASRLKPVKTEKRS